MSVICLPFNSRFLCVVDEHVASIGDKNLREFEIYVCFIGVNVPVTFQLFAIVLLASILILYFNYQW